MQTMAYPNERVQIDSSLLRGKCEYNQDVYAARSSLDFVINKKKLIFISFSHQRDNYRLQRLTCPLIFVMNQ